MVGDDDVFVFDLSLGECRREDISIDARERENFGERNKSLSSSKTINFSPSNVSKKSIRQSMSISMPEEQIAKKMCTFVFTKDQGKMHGCNGENEEKKEQL